MRRAGADPAARILQRGKARILQREVIAPRALRRNASPRRSSREVIGAILQRDPAVRDAGMKQAESF